MTLDWLIPAQVILTGASPDRTLRPTDQGGVVGRSEIEQADEGMRDPIRPPVWRKAKRNTTLSVSAVVIARDENSAAAAATTRRRRPSPPSTPDCVHEVPSLRAAA